MLSQSIGCSLVNPSLLGITRRSNVYGETSGHVFSRDPHGKYGPDAIFSKVPFAAINPVFVSLAKLRRPRFSRLERLGLTKLTWRVAPPATPALRESPTTSAVASDPSSPHGQAST